MLDPREAVGHLVSTFPDSVFISTCGFITRDLLAVSDRPSNFYLVGSMGMALPVALGILIARPELHVVAIDGDGSLAMNLAASLLVGEIRPRLVHAILDNGKHESTGGQRTLAIADYPAVGRGLGYDHVHEIRTLPTSLSTNKDTSQLIRYVCGERTSGPGPRMQIAPEDLVERFGSTLRDGLV